MPEMVIGTAQTETASETAERLRIRVIALERELVELKIQVEDPQPVPPAEDSLSELISWFDYQDELEIVKNEDTDGMVVIRSRRIHCNPVKSNGKASRFEEAARIAMGDG